MIEQELRNYIIEKKSIIIPDVQKHFGIKYKVVREVVAKMVKEGLLSLDDDLLFTYTNIPEEVPVFYKLVLWDCILNQNVNVTKLLQDYSLSITILKKIINWMKDNNYISNGWEIQITKKDFINIYGDVEKMTGKLQMLCHFPLPKLGTQEELQELKIILQKRLDILYNDDMDLELDEDFDDELSDYDQDALQKEFYDVLEAIILKDNSIGKEEAVFALENHFKLSEILLPAKKKDCQTLIDYIYRMSDAQFLEIKKIVLK